MATEDSVPNDIHDDISVGDEHRKDDDGLDEDEVKAIANEEGDDEGDDEKQDDTKADDDDKKAEASKSKSNMVPHDRFNEVNERAKAEKARADRAEAELAAMRQQPPKQEPPKQDQIPPKQDQTPAFDLKATIKARNEALMEGDTDLASELDLQIAENQQRLAEEKAVERVRNEQKADRERAEAESRQKEANDTIALGKELEGKYPILDPETGDQDIIAIVVAKHQRFMSQGIGMKAALQQAVDETMQKFGGVQPPADNKGDARNNNVREIDSKKKAADAANRQPPATAAGVGNRSDLSDKTVLVDSVSSADDWDSLPKAERDRMLGRA